jgi:hypothetical protein
MVLVWDVLSGEVVFERQVEGSSSFVQFSPKHNHRLMITLQANALDAPPVACAGLARLIGKRELLVIDSTLATIQSIANVLLDGGRARCRGRPGLSLMRCSHAAWWSTTWTRVLSRRG